MSTKKTPLKRECEYEGCTRKFAVPTEGRPKRYCSDLHRALASRERRREAAIPSGRALATNSLPDFDPPPQAGPVDPPPTQPPPRGVTVHTQTTGAHRNFGNAGAQTIIYVHERLTRRTTYGGTPSGEEVPRG